MGNVAVIAVIEQDGRVLITKKRKEEGHILSETWHIPGGKVEAGEMVEQALEREMREETGLDVEAVRLMEEMTLRDKDLTVFWFLCRVKGGQQKTGDDVVEVAFAPKKELFERCAPEAVSRWPPKVVEFLKK